LKAGRCRCTDRKEYEVVNISQLAEITGVDPVTPAVLKEKGLVKKIDAVKILGDGELSAGINVEAHKFSRSAMEKIEKAGGKVKII